VSIKGSPYARFRRALDTGNLALIRTAAAELPQVNLDDALRICLVIREREPESFDKAACRWLARYAMDRRATLARLAVAVAALETHARGPGFGPRSIGAPVNPVRRSSGSVLSANGPRPGFGLLNAVNRVPGWGCSALGSLSALGPCARGEDEA